MSTTGAGLHTDIRVVSAHHKSVQCGNNQGKVLFHLRDKRSLGGLVLLPLLSFISTGT
jgi:hypothetical protein